jgi:tetratricopeptide (TPR) repeat protein
MGFRARKSINLGGGVRLSASKSGLGLSAGTRGARYSVHSSGRRTALVGVPGSGVGYAKSWQAGSGGRGRQRPVPVQATAPPKPGMFAPGHEKAFYKAVQAFLGGDADGAATLFREAATKDAKDKSLSDDFFAGLISAQTGDDEAAIPLLEKVVQDQRPLPDELMAKYVPGGSLAVGVTEHVRVEVPFGSLAAVLTLVECYQANDRHEEAIGLLQQLVDLDGDPALVLSLCDLYAETDAWDEIVELAAGTRNEDDASLQVRLFQAEALERQGMNDAALETYKDALRSTKRDAALLKAARYGRGRLYLQLGKKAQGRKDLERVYADDPQYRDVADLLKPEADTPAARTQA